MCIFGWVRDIIGIRKDLKETNKAELELERLKDEKRERESIQRATAEDVKRYDRKTDELLRRLDRSSASLRMARVSIVVSIIAVLAAVLLFLFTR